MECGRIEKVEGKRGGVMAEVVKYKSIHHNAPTGKSFAIIMAFGKCVKVTPSEYTEWLSLRFEPPIIRTWKKKKFIEKLAKQKAGAVDA